MPRMQEGFRAAAMGHIRAALLKYGAHSVRTFDGGTRQLCLRTDNTGVIKQRAKVSCHARLSNAEEASFRFRRPRYQASAGTSYLPQEAVSLLFFLFSLCFNTVAAFDGRLAGTSLAPNISTVPSLGPLTYPNRPNPDSDLNQQPAVQQATTMFAVLSKTDTSAIPIQLPSQR